MLSWPDSLFQRREGLRWTAAAARRFAAGSSWNGPRILPPSLKVWTFYADVYGRREVSVTHANIVLSLLSDPAAQVLYV